LVFVSDVDDVTGRSPTPSLRLSRGLLAFVFTVDDVDVCSPSSVQRGLLVFVFAVDDAVERSPSPPLRLVRCLLVFVFVVDVSDLFRDCAV